jgi:hypothetical protein
MEIIIKKERVILNQVTTIGFVFKPKFADDFRSFKDFDIGNTDEEVENALIKFDEEAELFDKPIRTAASMLFFEAITNLHSVIYETNDMKATIKRKDILREDEE